MNFQDTGLSSVKLGTVQMLLDSKQQYVCDRNIRNIDEVQSQWDSITSLIAWYNA